MNKITYGSSGNTSGKLLDSNLYAKVLYDKTEKSSFFKRKIVKNKKGELQFGGVIYGDSADKATRFIGNCNQRKIPLVFIQDVTGFMVGSKAEHSGIIKDGAKMAAKSKGREDEWLFTLQFPSYYPFMKFSSRRDLRKELMTASVTKCNGGEFDNTDICKRIAKLKHERAMLLGSVSYTHLTLPTKA